MNDLLTYRLLVPDDIPAVHDLIRSVFLADIAPHYASEGQEEFLRYVTPDALHARRKMNYCALVAVLDGAIIGVIEIRDHSHLSLLFVGRCYQGQGLGRELLHRSVTICLKNRVDVLTLTVHASPNAVCIYEKLGFRQLHSEQVSHGIRFTLMELSLLDGDLLNYTSKNN